MQREGADVVDVEKTPEGRVGEALTGSRHCQRATPGLLSYYTRQGEAEPAASPITAAALAQMAVEARQTLARTYSVPRRGGVTRGARMRA